MSPMRITSSLARSFVSVTAWGDLGPTWASLASWGGRYGPAAWSSYAAWSSDSTQRSFASLASTSSSNIPAVLASAGVP